jgi:hypothetical protein
VADGAAAVAYSFDTQNTYSTTGADLVSFLNNATPKFNITKDGGIDIKSGATTASHSASINLNLTSSGASTSSGQYSFVAGESCLASNYAAIAMGYFSSATGNSSQAFGTSATSSGQSAVAFNGIASADYAFCGPGGGVVSNQYSAGFGYQPFVQNRCTLAIAGAHPLSTWPSQAMIASLTADTTNATQTTLKAFTTDYTIQPDVTWAFTGIVVARSDEADGNVSAAWKIEGVLYRDESNNTVIQGVAVTTIYNGSTDSPQWSVVVQADDTGEALAIKVTGAAATNIRWHARVDLAQVGYT